MQSKVLIAKPNPKQAEFFKADARFIAYGGARAGGKSWAVRKKVMLLALRYAGIRILLLRRTFPELRENHILPLMADLTGLATYKEVEKAFNFVNGSRLKFGYCDSETDVNQYQGQEYDVIFIDEATQFTEYQYSTLTACLRGSNAFPKRMYLTCNPGGVGHAWVKRLFIDRDYRLQENPSDYIFIPATVYDNTHFLEYNSAYVQMLENLPKHLREAWLYGNWNIMEGQYFSEFRQEIHVIAPFEIPSHWNWYFTMDYGFDMAAFYWIAVDECGRGYVVREFCQGKDNGLEPLIISEAAKVIRDLTRENITAYLAPPDLFNARQESGKSVAEIFAEFGIYLTKTSNARVDGWFAVKEWLKPYEVAEGVKEARLAIFENCHELIKNLPLLQYDRKNINDVSNQPHKLTHSPDALRGFCVHFIANASSEVDDYSDDIDYNNQINNLMQYVY